MRVLAVNWRDIGNPEAGGAEVHLHEILARFVGWGHTATLIAAGWPGCAREERIDGIRILRRGHWYDANWALLLFARGHLKRETYDVVLEDINKLPFFMPLVTSTSVVPVIPHLFGTTVFREANAVVGTYVVLMERLIPLVFRRNRFMVISQSTKDDLVARGVAADRIDVVLCGLDHRRYRSLGLERFADPTIVHLGRLRRYKSVEGALRASSDPWTRLRAWVPASARVRASLSAPDSSRPERRSAGRSASPRLRRSRSSPRTTRDAR